MPSPSPVECEPRTSPPTRDRGRLMHPSLDEAAQRRVFMFPGQSSRYPGMLRKLAALSPGNRLLLERASDLLGRDLLAHFSDDNPEVFARNLDIQLGVFLANQLFLQLLDDAGLQAGHSLGLSLGEYNHLVHIGALSFEEALLLVQARGLAYDAGPRGLMASVYPIDEEELRGIAGRASVKGVVELANLNSPRQHVLSGEADAVMEAIRIVEEETFAQSRIIERQVPMHCSIFEPVGRAFREVLERTPFKRPRLPYLPNRLAELLVEPDRAMFVDLLASHVFRPVLWRRSIDLLAASIDEPVFVEVGPMAVLHNLLDRKWLRATRHHLDSAEDTPAQVASVLSALNRDGRDT